jgi:hypothetical protein
MAAEKVVPDAGLREPVELTLFAGSGSEANEGTNPDLAHAELDVRGQ